MVLTNSLSLFWWLNMYALKPIFHLNAILPSNQKLSCSGCVTHSFFVSLLQCLNCSAFLLMGQIVSLCEQTRGSEWRQLYSTTIAVAPILYSVFNWQHGLYQEFVFLKLNLYFKNKYDWLWFNRNCRIEFSNSNLKRIELTLFVLTVYQCSSGST